MGVLTAPFYMRCCPPGRSSHRVGVPRGVHRGFLHRSCIRSSPSHRPEVTKCAVLGTSCSPRWDLHIDPTTSALIAGLIIRIRGLLYSLLFFCFGSFSETANLGTWRASINEQRILLL